MIEYIVGIDPGKTGAIAVMHKGKIVNKVPIPLISTKEIDNFDLNIIFRNIRTLADKVAAENGNDLLVIMEHVHSIFGAAAKANFQFGRVNGLLEGFIAAYGLKYILVAPKTWQKEMHAGIPVIKIPARIVNKRDGTKVKKKEKVDIKKMSALAVQRLFPEVDCTTTPRSSKPHEGIVDAILMAEYGRRKYAKDSDVN